ncbi:MAG: hypothetical protein JW969_15485 [Spirochaetales bacterium]|nr:hypothetical protein [Spirochaetales bacterium]
MQDITVILSVAFIFFLFIPGIGANIVRIRWKRFRNRLVESSLYPIVDYSNIAGPSAVVKGIFRFFGTLEAIQGENRIWLTNGDFSIACDLTDVVVYMLPEEPLFENNNPEKSELEESFNEAEPSSMRWDRISSIPEGTKMFISGVIHVKNGRGIFKSASKNPLLVVIYEGNKTGLLKRAISTGRQRNEYWNQFTWISLITGICILFLMSFFLFQKDISKTMGFLTVSLSILPPSIFLPPGVFFFFLYRFFWKKARRLRAQRDLFMLPLRYFKDISFPDSEKERCAELPDHTKYIMIKTGEKDNKSYYPIIGEVKTEINQVFPGQNPEKNENYLFGSFIEKEDGSFITTPADPMAELIYFPGNPGTAAAVCNKKAWLLASISFLFMFIGLCCNFTLIFLILQNFIK